MMDIAKDKIVIIESKKGKYVWGCGPYRARCRRHATGSCPWSWTVWKDSGGLKTVQGSCRTLWQAQFMALDCLKKLTGVYLVESGDVPGRRANSPEWFRRRLS